MLIYRTNIIFVRIGITNAFVKFAFKFAALSDATTAVTIPLVSPKIIFALATLAVSLNVVA